MLRNDLPVRPGRVALMAGLCALAACSNAPRRPPVPSEFDDAGLRHEVSILSSARFDGRRPGSAGARATVDYLVARFQLYGLKPAVGGSYTQGVPLVELALEAQPRLSFARPGAAPVSLAYRSDMLLWTPRESGAGSIARSGVVFVGYGIDARALHRDDYAGVDVRGKTVLALSGLPPPAGGGPRQAGSQRGERYGLAEYKYEEAARHGAAGVVLIHVDAARTEPWEAVVNRYAGGTIEAPAADAHAGRAAVEGWIRAAAARRLFAAAGADFAELEARAARADFRATALGLAADAEVRARVVRFVAPNVVAMVPGRGHRRECIVYTAHWDHLGRAAGRADGAVLPGAVDDASGVAGLLLLAQRFAHADPRPDRTIVFLVSTAGEFGSLGAAWYADHPAVPLRDTLADIDLDMLHIGGPTRDVSSLALGESQLDGYLAGAADLQGRVVRGDPEPARGRFVRSDARVFAEHGVPALYAVGGLDDAAMGPAWGRARLDEYFARRYRRTADRYSPDWDLRGTLDDLRLYYDVGMRLARARRFPEWYPDRGYGRGLGDAGGTG